ncbi:hypothetical protein HY249_01605 [Candidatus Azambacteria bacterium]|nr:hypothetical protein [Candidatus Azambacteria bacterium]
MKRLLSFIGIVCFLSTLFVVQKSYADGIISWHSMAQQQRNNAYLKCISMLQKNKNIIAIIIAGILISAAFLYNSDFKKDFFRKDYGVALPKSEKWIEYQNGNLGYYFLYPQSINSIKIPSDDSVYFDGPDGFWNIKIFVYKDTVFNNVDGWLKKNEDEGKFEKKIKIMDKYDALILNDLRYEKKINESDSIKKLALIADGNLIEVYTRNIDHEKFWSLFSIRELKGSLFKDVKIYQNKKYGYYFSYPKNWALTDSDPSDVYFGEQMSPVIIRVENTDFKTAYEWYLKNKSHLRLEKIIKIGGYEAVVTHNNDSGGVEEFPEEKSAVFVKDDYLFKLYTSYIDHEKIWENFKFESLH